MDTNQKENDFIIQNGKLQKKTSIICMDFQARYLPYAE